jgi:hypothetical protein
MLCANFIHRRPFLEQVILSEATSFLQWKAKLGRFLDFLRTESVFASKDVA